jgi:hypothetical protein
VIKACQGLPVKFRHITICDELSIDLHKCVTESGLTDDKGCENLPGRTLTTPLTLRSTPRRGLKSYLKFALRFIGVSEDADVVQGA